LGVTTTIGGEAAYGGGRRVGGWAGELAGSFVQREAPPHAVIVEFGQSADQVVLIAHGKAHRLGDGQYGKPILLGALADGDHFGDRTLVEAQDTWPYTVKAVTACTVLVRPHHVLEVVASQPVALRAHVTQRKASLQRPQNR
jgi:CRP-like cAMP-binding protein